MMWIATILFILCLAIDLVTDYKKILQRKKINHTTGGIIRGIFLIPCIVLFIRSSDADLWFAIPGAIGMVLFHFWFWFDGILSTLRGYGWFFLGSDDPDDAQTDNFLQGLKLWQHVAIKLLGMVGFTVLYFVTK